MIHPDALSSIFLRHDRVFIASGGHMTGSTPALHRLAWHIYLYDDGVISFTVTARQCLHRSFSTKSTNLSKSSKRKKHRPAAIATNGSSATTVVQAAGMDLNFAAASWK
jgi:hypothetical protein